MSVVVIGQSSFMAQEVKKKSPEWTFLSHGEALSQTDWTKKAACIVNFAFDPRMRTGGYIAEADIDSKLARMIEGTQAHYIMLSSRMVYGAPISGFELHENDPANPVNPYGQSKLRIENALQDILGNRLTILRLSNIFGFEPGRRSFFGMALTRLAREKKIVYDMSPKVRRDFLSVWKFADTLKAIAAAPRPGLYNLGSGIGLETAKIAEWLIAGYGEGSLVIERDAENDQFWLDMNKTNQAYSLAPLTIADLQRDCMACGERLKSWKES